MPLNNPSSVFIKNTDVQEILNIISNLKNTSPGWDDIYTCIIKENGKFLAEILTHLLNLSLGQGTLPNELKLAKVIPLYKSNNPAL